MFKRFIYKGPNSGITVQYKDGENDGVQEVLLRDGCVVDLPPDHSAVKTLQAKGFLSIAPADAAPAVEVPTPIKATAKSGK